MATAAILEVPNRFPATANYEADCLIRNHYLCSIIAFSRRLAAELWWSTLGPVKNTCTRPQSTIVADDPVQFGFRIAPGSPTSRNPAQSRWTGLMAIQKLYSRSSFSFDSSQLLALSPDYQANEFGIN